MFPCGRALSKHNNSFWTSSLRFGAIVIRRGIPGGGEIERDTRTSSVGLSGNRSAIAVHAMR